MTEKWRRIVVDTVTHAIVKYLTYDLVTYIPLFHRNCDLLFELVRGIRFSRSFVRYLKLQHRASTCYTVGKISKSPECNFLFHAMLYDKICLLSNLNFDRLDSINIIRANMEKPTVSIINSFIYKITTRKNKTWRHVEKKIGITTPINI